jgi:transcriptional regulator
MRRSCSLRAGGRNAEAGHDRVSMMGGVFIHGADAGEETEWRAFLAGHPFGELVAGGGPERRVPVVVPTQFVVEGDDVLVHLLARNPLWDAVAENPTVVLAVSGDWAFVPSSWKAIGDEDPRLGIPTTYYASVQLTGTVTVIDDPDDVAAVLRVQLAALQPDEDVVDPSEHPTRLRSIRALRMRVDDVRAKFKYGGNVDRAHRDAALTRLADRDGPGDREAAAHLQRRIDR